MTLYYIKATPIKCTASTTTHCGTIPHRDVTCHSKKPWVKVFCSLSTVVVVVMKKMETATTKRRALRLQWTRSVIRQRWGGVVHAKAPPATDSFDYRPFQIDSVDTKWGETIQAQRLLYRAALEKYPTAKYFFLLSGDTIPIRDIDTIEKTMHLIDSSVVQIMREVQWVDHKIKKEKKWTLINSHMNNVLVRKQVEFLASYLTENFDTLVTSMRTLTVGSLISRVSMVSVTRNCMMQRQRICWTLQSKRPWTLVLKSCFLGK